jgi:hypothetical protein
MQAARPVVGAAYVVARRLLIANVANHSMRFGSLQCCATTLSVLANDDHVFGQFNWLMMSLPGWGLGFRV